MTREFDLSGARSALPKHLSSRVNLICKVDLRGKADIVNLISMVDLMWQMGRVDQISKRDLGNHTALVTTLEMISKGIWAAKWYLLLGGVVAGARWSRDRHQVES